MARCCCARPKLDLFLIKFSLWGEAYGGCPINVAVPTGALLTFVEPWARDGAVEEMDGYLPPAPCVQTLFLFPSLHFIYGGLKPQKGSVRDLCRIRLKELRDASAISRPLFPDGETKAQRGAGRAPGAPPPSPALSLERDLKYSQSRPRLSSALQLWEPPACNLPNVTVSWPRWYSLSQWHLQGCHLPRRVRVMDRGGRSQVLAGSQSPVAYRSSCRFGGRLKTLNDPKNRWIVAPLDGCGNRDTKMECKSPLVT